MWKKYLTQRAPQTESAWVPGPIYKYQGMADKLPWYLKSKLKQAEVQKIRMEVHEHDDDIIL